jgi:glycosyltransferase involved in cell wall biosynthesis
VRILIATDHYPPFIGGAHRWAFLLARGLAGRGHDVSVLTEWHGGMERVERDEAVEHSSSWPVYRVRQLRTTPTSRITDDAQRHSPPFHDPVTAHDAAKLIDEIQPEVCISHGWITFSVLGPLKRRRVPVMLSAHDYGYFCATRQLLHDGGPCSGPAPVKCLNCASDLYGRSFGTAAVLGLLREKPRLADGVDGVQTVSSFVDEVTWEHLFGAKGPAHHVRRYIIPAFVEMDEVLSAEDIAERDDFVEKLPEEPFIMFAGALRKIKGVDVLLDAYAQLREPRPPLVMMGTTHPDTPENLPDGAQIITNVPHAIVMAGWERALLGVVPSVWPEPLGTVSIESAGVGTPTIAGYPSGMVDVVGGGAGILVRQGSVSELRDAMQLLIDDPELRAKISKTGAERVRRFDAERVLSEYEEALSELVGDRAATMRPPAVALRPAR